jgi:hypothetical protein
MDFGGFVIMTIGCHTDSVLSSGLQRRFATDRHRSNAFEGAGDRRAIGLCPTPAKLEKMNHLQ